MTKQTAAPIARTSSNDEGKAKKRWSEYEIERAPKGAYRVREIGRSIVAGETTRLRESVCVTGEQVYEALTAGTAGLLSRTAYLAMLEGGEHDADFAAIVRDVLPEDITPASGNRRTHPKNEIVLDRPPDSVGRPRRAIRFRGKRIGVGMSTIDFSKPWTAIALYRLIDGRLLCAKDLMIQDGLRSSARDRTVTIGDDAGAIVRALVRPGRAWVETALVDAIDAARSQDASLDREIGPDAATEEWADAIALGEGASVRYGDARFAVLNYIDPDGRIVSLDGETDVSILGIMGGAAKANVAAPELTPRLFLALSRQELICRDRVAEAAASGVAFACRWLDSEALKRIEESDDYVSVWCISDIGREVLARAKARGA